MATTTRSRKTTASKAKRAPSKAHRGGLLSKRKKILISVGIGLVVFLVGAYLFASQAATSYVAFVGNGGKCLDNHRNIAANGNKIQLYTCNNKSAQQWKVNANGSITNANGYCLDVKNASKTRGTIVWLYRCNGTVAQKWTVSGKTIKNPHSGLCLDAKNGGTANYTQIQVWTCNGTTAQQWTSKAPDNTPPAPPTGSRKHFIPNAGPADVTKVKALGFNVIDASPGNISEVNKLPAGIQAMIWVGGWRCEPFSTSFNDFKTFVTNNRNNAKIYGYYLYDEMDTHQCEKNVAEIKKRADFIHCLSNDTAKVNSAGECLENGRVVPRRTDKKAFIVEEYNFDHARISQAKTHVDLFGIDPYPCRPNGCKYSGSPDYFKERMARAKQYYSQSSIVPVYQAFGGDGWKLPTADQMRTILSEFDKNFPNAPMDVSYTWRQNTPGQNASLSESSALQQVIKDHNAKY